MDRLAGSSIVVTGAGSGIGREFALAFAAEGARVGVLDRDHTAAQDVTAEVLAAGGDALALQADVSQRVDVAQALAEFVAWSGSLNVIFNNAGFNKPMPFMEITEENWHAIMNVNALGVLICTQEAAKLMILQKSGKIINTSSIAGRQAFPDFTPYSASKFAVNALTQATARALAEHGITCNSFSPGVVATPLWQTLDRDLLAMGSSSKPDEAIENFSADILMGRPAQPRDLVGTAIFLASADSDYMTGQTIMIDGGKVLV